MTKYSKIVPCIWLDGGAEGAAAFYLEHLSGRVTAISRYPESFDNPIKKPRGSVMAVACELAGQRFTILNGGPLFRPNLSISFFVQVESRAEAGRLFAALQAGGEVLAQLGTYPWSECYGFVRDQFGVGWQVLTASRKAGTPVIVPCLMFNGAHHGQAEEAVRFYAECFPGGAVSSMARFGPGEGPEGLVKHSRFTIAGQEFAATDSHQKHDFTFNEGLSLQMMCGDQAEVDRYWELLGSGGLRGPCGWLRDRFGVSWQVVPEQLQEWMATSDSAARDRAYSVMMAMGKLDVATLQRAMSGAS